ncbi:MAG: lipoate--protein ligase family protein [Acidilobus sp.]
MRLRLVTFEEPEDPYFNLAFEEAVPRARGCGLVPDTLRVWRNANAVIIGYFQRAEEEVNLDVAGTIGASVVRRFTGGGAVYHDLGNLNYALSTSTDGEKGTLDFIFSQLIRGPIAALRALGLQAEVQNVNDVIVAGRKVSGTAATISWGSTFFHGAMLVSTDLSRLASVLKVSRKKLIDKGVSNVKYRVTNLSEIKPVGIDEIIHALASSFSTVLGHGGYYISLPTNEELEIANVLYNEKYVKREWNFSRAPHRAFPRAEEGVARICHR